MQVAMRDMRTCAHEVIVGLLRAVLGQAPLALPSYNFLRKPASDFGWDWGPAFAPIGLGGVTLVGDQGIEMLGADLLPRAHCTGNTPRCTKAIRAQELLQGRLLANAGQGWWPQRLSDGIPGCERACENQQAG